MIKPRIYLLKEGSETQQGHGHLISNINACKAVADLLRTTLGPMGMDKLIRKDDNVTISNDGATIIRLLDVVHPAAKILTDTAQAQDDEIGDGTTSVVLLTAELLQNAKEFIEENVNVQTIIKGYRKACEIALKHLQNLEFNFESLTPQNFDLTADQSILLKESPKRFLLEQCAKTSLTSKLIENDKDFFAKMLCDAFLLHAESSKGSRTGRDFLKVSPISGGSIKESFLFDGVAFKKTFSYAGFESQPKYFLSPKIALLNIELELKSENMSAEIRVSPGDFKSMVDAEWKILYDKLNSLKDAKVDIVLSKLPIGDLATQFFADNGMFCAGRVISDDLKRLANLSGGVILTTLKDINRNGVLGTCESFEEKQIGKERINFFSRSKNKERKTTSTINMSTIILRGGVDQYIEEASRSLNDAIMVVKNTLLSKNVVAGAGAVDMELSKILKKYSNEIEGDESFFVGAFAKAMEVIPQSIAANGGMDSTDVLSELRSKHHSENCENIGIDVLNERTTDAKKSFIWEPAISKRNILKSATEAACLILSVDQTVKSPRSEENNRSMQTPGGPQMGMQMPMQMKR